MEQEQKTRKERSDKGKPRGPKSERKKPTNHPALEKAEAAMVNAFLTGFVASRYGEMPNPPNQSETDHLAKIIRAIASVPPFSYIQTFIAKLFPFSGAGKPGDNPFADAFRYAKAWYDRNPDLADRIYVSDPKIPNLPMYPKQGVINRTNRSNGFMSDNPANKRMDNVSPIP